MDKLIQIDGSLGEGGGQVLRTALTLSLVYRKPIEIINIRAGRPKPGLAAQHLAGVKLARDMCNAQVKGAFIGSTRLEFLPGIPPNDRSELEFVADIGTAGCICLLAQLAIPCALFMSGPVRLILKGGTNVPMGPHIEYLTEVFKPMLNRFGADFDFVVVRRGYYPKGGGQVDLHIKPVTSLTAITMKNPGPPTGITGWAYVAGAVHINEAHKMASDAKQTLIETLKKHNIDVPPISIEVYREDRAMAVGNGSGINVVCKTSNGCVFGGSGLGSAKPEHPPPGVVAANELLKPLIAASCVDEHLMDQMLIFMLLAGRESKVDLGSMKLTSHAQTVIQIIKLMLKPIYRLGKLRESFTVMENGSGESANRTIESFTCKRINERLIVDEYYASLDNK